jgi:hypothetical protein
LALIPSLPLAFSPPPHAISLSLLFSLPLPTPPPSHSFTLPLPRLPHLALTTLFFHDSFFLSTYSAQPLTHLVPPKAPQKPVGPVVQLGAWLWATPQLQGIYPSPESVGPSEPAPLTGFCGSHGHRKFLTGDPWGGEE